MADRIVFHPGISGFFRGAFLPPDMVEDMRTIARIPDDQIDAIATALEAEIGFLDKEKLSQLVGSVVDDESCASAVVIALNNLRSQQLEQIFEALEKWRQADQQNAEVFSDETFADLKVKLSRLIKDYSALARFRKTRRLRSILGNTVEEIEIICDARPVYNDTRDLIEGLIPITTLKIEYEGQDEETHEVEVMLTRDGVNDLAKKVEKAQQKLDVLGESISQWIPNGLADSE